MPDQEDGGQNGNDYDQHYKPFGHLFVILL